MGVYTGEAAYQESLRTVAFEESLFMETLYGFLHNTLLTAHAKHERQKPLEVPEAFVLAQLHASVAFLHSLQHHAALTADFRGRELNFSTSLYRLQNFVRTAELLRLTGVLREDVFEANKLFLGSGDVIGDVYPFAYEFKVLDLEAFLATDFHMEHAHDPENLINRLINRGVVSVRRRNGDIIAVDNDEVIARAGAGWAQTMGIDVESHIDSARGYLNNQTKQLKRRQIGLVAAVRLDPLMVGGDPLDAQAFQKKSGQLAANLRAVAAGAKLVEGGGSEAKGQVLFTIGSGKRTEGEPETYKEWEQHKLRRRALGSLKVELGKLGSLLHKDMADLEVGLPWLLPEASDLEVMVANSAQRKLG